MRHTRQLFADDVQLFPQKCIFEIHLSNAIQKPVKQFRIKLSKQSCPFLQDPNMLTNIFLHWWSFLDRSGTPPFISMGQQSGSSSAMMMFLFSLMHLFFLLPGSFSHSSLIIDTIFPGIEIICGRTFWFFIRPMTLFGRVNQSFNFFLQILEMFRELFAFKTNNFKA